MLMGIATFTASFISTYQLMLLAILFMSIGPSMFHPPALGELARRFPNKRGLAVSMHGFGANIGEVLGPITIAGLLLIFVDWRDIMRISIVPAALISIGLWIIIDKPKLTEETSISSLSEYFKSLLETLRNKTMIVLIIAISLKSIGEGAVGTYIPLYLIEELGIDEIRIGLLLSLAQTMGIISQPIMGNLSDTKGRKIVMFIGTGCVGLLSIGLAVMAHPSIASIDSSFVIIGLWAIIIGKGAFTFSLHHIYLAAALDVSAAKTQSSIVAIMYGSGIISTFSPYLAGLMADKYGFYSAFLLGGVILVVAALVLLFFKTTKQQINS
jgi:MFS family permease